MAILFVFLIGLPIAIGAWFLVNYFDSAWLKYSDNVSNETKKTFDDAFLFLDIAKLRPIVWLTAVIGTITIAWLIGRWWGILPALLLWLLLPKFSLGYLKQKRITKFDSQLPDLIMSLAGAVKAGSGLQHALQNIVNHSQGPVAQEFNLLMREQRLGVNFTQALLNLNQRMPTESCALLVSALSLAAQTGGSVAEILENIAETIRTRQYWSSRVKALTAQGRMQSVIMASLPVLLLFVLTYLEPDDMALIWETWFGWLFLMAILILEIIGIFWIRRIANIEI